MQISFEMPSNSIERLRILMDKTKSLKSSDVLGDALALFEWAVEKVGEGYKISAVNDSTNCCVEVSLKSLERVSKIKNS